MTTIIEIKVICLFRKLTGVVIELLSFPLSNGKRNIHKSTIYLRNKSNNDGQFLVMVMIMAAIMIIITIVIIVAVIAVELSI